MYEFKMMMFVCDSLENERMPYRTGKSQGNSRITPWILMDEVINRGGELYADYRISVGQFDENKEDGEQEKYLKYL
jgi:hypothetical protein